MSNYVDNSLLAYKAIWRLESRADSAREPKHIKLELHQMIAGQEDFLIKYFVDLGEHVLVATFYGPMDKKRKLRRRYGDLDHWLMLPTISD